VANATGTSCNGTTCIATWEVSHGRHHAWCRRGLLAWLCYVGSGEPLLMPWPQNTNAARCQPNKAAASPLAPTVCSLRATTAAPARARATLTSSPQARPAAAAWWRSAWRRHR
jgi:hypothetical protein